MAQIRFTLLLHYMILAPIHEPISNTSFLDVQVFADLLTRGDIRAIILCENSFKEALLPLGWPKSSLVAD